jgi:ribosomal-protein-serine acetyltransferase
MKPRTQQKVVEQKLKRHLFPLRISDNIVLDIIQAHQTEEFFELVDANRDYLRQWIPWLDECQTTQEALKFILNSLRDTALERSIRCGIFRSGQLIGSIEVRFLWEGRNCEIGYWISEAFQGKGIVTQACALMLGCLFKEMGMEKVVLYCAVKNTKSQAVATRLGFTRHAELAESEWLYDHYVERFRYVLPRRELCAVHKNALAAQ